MNIETETQNKNDGHIRNKDIINLEILYLKEFGDRFSISLTQLLIFEGALLWALVQLGQLNDILIKAIPVITISIQVLFNIIYNFTLIQITDVHKFIKTGDLFDFAYQRLDLTLDTLSLIILLTYFKFNWIIFFLLLYFSLEIIIPILMKIFVKWILRKLSEFFKIMPHRNQFFPIGLNHYRLIFDILFFSLCFLSLKDDLIIKENLKTIMMLFSSVFIFKIFLVSKYYHNQIGDRYRELINITTEDELQKNATLASN